ncbi:MAG: S46 family peptidase, partial [Odoribacter sp.]|nr:S46 family peptidase [Odoribacter sp.]
MKRKLLSVLLFFALATGVCRADEGMWIPMLLKKYNIEEMQRQGFKLTAEDIYDINRACLKDAVVGLGREDRPFSHFCTGEIVSNEGLVITNHHCAFSMIQAHSSLEHNYLRDGFWAKNKAEELANPGITASILVRMEDVTDKIQAQLKPGMSDAEKNKKLRETIAQLEREAVEGTDLMANIRPYFNGNQYFMSVFRIYKDVRLVGAPPSAIGKFGGDTDNWMWPRHTGDFSVLRIYAGKNNEPAAYAPDNVPYRPASFFKVSAKGVQEGDFTMVFGYPGTTTEYLPSFAIEQIQEVENPNKVAIRTAKLGVINAAMESDELLRIKYAAKAASIANSWKRWQGEIKGLKRFNTVGRKQATEEAFRTWAKDHREYAGLLDKYQELYSRRKPLILAWAYYSEAGKQGAEILELANIVSSGLKNERMATQPEEAKQALIAKVDEFFKDYDVATDQKIMREMLKIYYGALPVEWVPGEIAKAGAKGIDAYVENLFGKTIFADQQRVTEFIRKSTPKSADKLAKDPVSRLSASMTKLYKEKIYPELTKINSEITLLNRDWLTALMQMQPEKVFYADANSTLRVAYGKVQGYSPADAVYYQPYTTLAGIIAKDNPDIYDYNVPQRLKELYAARDFGSYGMNGEMPVCFIATNHTTGGNSGSPVLNADGELI